MPAKLVYVEPNASVNWRSSHSRNVLYAGRFPSGKDGFGRCANPSVPLRQNIAQGPRTQPAARHVAQLQRVALYTLRRLSDDSLFPVRALSEEHARVLL